MIKIEIIVDPSARPEEPIDELCAIVPELVPRWNTALSEAERSGSDSVEFDCFKLSATPSKNFQVIDMLYKCIRGFAAEHRQPGLVRIKCDSEESARMYRQIYNFYIPRTKEERMCDSSWD